MPNVEENGWTLSYTGFDPERERLREALMATGNGYMGSRAAAPEARHDATHYPGTYVAGLFNRVSSRVGDRDLEHESMVNVPNWLPLRLSIEGGEPLSPESALILDFHQSLDMRRGLMGRRYTLEDAAGRRTRVAERRLASMADRHLAALEVTVESENWSGEIEILSAVDGDVANTGVPRYLDLESRHLEGFETRAEGDLIGVRAVTTQSRTAVGVVARTRLAGSSSIAQPVGEEERWAAHRLAVSLEAGSAVTVEKVAAIATSRDPAIGEPFAASWRRARAAPGFEDLARRHVIRWDHLWQRLDLETPANPEITMTLRLHLFHLAQTICENTIDLDVSAPARGLTGEAYRGHYFWDEMFLARPMALKMPETVAAINAYRHRRLDAARRAAADAGHEGAMFPWQSGSDGREESQTYHLNPKSGQWKADRSQRQRHIGLAIAFNAWHHFEATGDIETLASTGAELILEVARFFSSLAEHERLTDRYVIRGVMGPDEYHDGYPDREEGGLDNNAYTNVMTAWLMVRALDTLERLPDERRLELTERLGIVRSELDRWEHMSRRMHVPFLEDGLVIAQFDGYDELEELDWEAYRSRYGDIHRLDRILDAEDDTTNRYKLSKQADALMLHFLLSVDELERLMGRLGYEYGERAMEQTIEHYLARTAHGSTLSRVVHSWVLARFDRERSWRLFCEALEADVADVQGGTTEEGIHLGAMAGTVDIAQRIFLGLDPHEDVLWLDPQPVESLGPVRTSIHYRGHRGIEVRLYDGSVRLAVPDSGRPPITIGHLGELHEVAAGEAIELAVR